MAQKRLRIFAGPNGSGKSSMLRQVTDTVPLGFYINADVIEKLIISNKEINLIDFGIKSNDNALHSFFRKSGFVKKKSDAKQLKNIFKIYENKISVTESTVAPKYSAAIIADFLREQNLKAGNDFSFETVMSHIDKLRFIKRANRIGYHCYLYFICTDDVRVNIKRIKARVKEGGHSVPISKVKSRYKRTLKLLYNALKVCYKSYLFDNSDKMIEIGRVNRDKRLHISVKLERIPNWFIDFVLKA